MQVAASAMSWSPVQTSTVGCVYLIVCDLETSTVRQPRPNLGCCTTGKKWCNRLCCL